MTLDVHADISVYVGQIVVLIHACVAALLKVGVVVDLSNKDHITAIAKVCADIIVSISGCVGVFANILVNLTAVVTLDIAVQAWLVQLNLCVSGVIAVIAPLCVSHFLTSLFSGLLSCSFAAASASRLTLTSPSRSLSPFSAFKFSYHIGHFEHWRDVACSAVMFRKINILSWHLELSDTESEVLY